MQIDLAYAGSIVGVEQAARSAKERGYGGLWTSETRHDPFLTLSLAARACPDLEIGSGIAVLGQLCRSDLAFWLLCLSLHLDRVEPMERLLQLQPLRVCCTCEQEVCIQS